MKKKTFFSFSAKYSASEHDLIQGLFFLVNSPTYRIKAPTYFLIWFHLTPYRPTFYVSPKLAQRIKAKKIWIKYEVNEEEVDEKRWSRHSDKKASSIFTFPIGG